MSRPWIAKLRRVASEPEVLRAVAELQQYVEERYLEREIATNTSEQVKAFEGLMTAIADTPNAVVLIGNLLVAKHTGPNGNAETFAQSLTPDQMRVVESNPGILASPQRVLEMMSLAISAQVQDASDASP